MVGLGLMCGQPPDVAGGIKLENSSSSSIHSLISSAFVHLSSHLHRALELHIIRTYTYLQENPREINGGFVRPQQPQPPRPQSSPLPFISINL